MLQQLQQDYAALAGRVQLLEVGMTSTESLQADYATLNRRLLELELRESSRTVHKVLLVNDGTLPSSGLMKFGLSFEKGDVPGGRTLRITAGGVTVRSAMLDIATWSDGSLRKSVVAVDVGETAGKAAVELEISVVLGNQAVNTFDVVAFVAGLSNDCEVSVLNRKNFSGLAMSSLKFNLKDAYAVSTRREVTDNTNLLVRARCWQKASGEEHLVCLHYLDIWLAADGRTVLGWEWVPVISQHWWVDNPFGTPQVKQSYTYDAAVSAGGTTVDTRNGLTHAYYCRWASLYSSDDDQHCTPHWIAVSHSKPRLRIEYSLASRKKMARVGGYMPPLNWTDTGYKVTSGRTYVPLGLNGHRAQINNVGAYDGRGQVTRMDANAIALQTAEAWRVMRVGAQAGLALYNALYDHRVTDSQPFMRLIPQKFAVLGTQNYLGLGIEANHSRGSSYDTGQKDLFEVAAVGSKGAFAGYDNDHGVPYPSFAAFITGEKYLHDAALSQADFCMSYSNMNIYGHNKSFEFGGPNTPRHGTIPSTGGVRGRAFSMNMLTWAWATCADSDPHKIYLQKALQNYDDFLLGSYTYFLDGHKAWGGWFWNAPSYYSTWMHAFVAMMFSQWHKLIKDLGYGEGFTTAAKMCAKPIARGLDNKRKGVLPSYVFRVPVGAGIGSSASGWLDTDGLYALHAATYANSQFSITSDTYSVNNGDKVLLAPYNSSNGISGLTWPTELNFTTIYYAVNVSVDTFSVSTSKDGLPIPFSGSGSTSLGLDKASYDVEVAKVPFGGDSYAMITLASLVASYMAGNTDVTQEHVTQFRKFLSTSRRAEYGPWNYSEEQT